MAKFRKKPVVIEAVQFLHDGAGTGNHDEIGPLVTYWRDSDTPVIDTLEGSMIVSNGDWIIRGVKGELYPCKDDIFRLTYEPVE